MYVKKKIIAQKIRENVATLWLMKKSASVIYMNGPLEIV